MKKKIIVCSPIRNEEFNLKRVLPAWSTFADYIILADQNSDDNSLDIANQFEKVVLIANDNQNYNEATRTELLVNKAREISQESVLVFLDADETLSANVTANPEWKTFLESRPGTVGYFRWIQLWDRPDYYISSGYSNSGYSSFAFVDDGRPCKRKGVIHVSRGLGEDNPTSNFYFNQIVCLHLNGLNKHNNIKKQNWYKVWYIAEAGAKKYFHTNRNHNWYRSVKECNLSLCKSEWFSAYLVQGIDITSWESEPLQWRDVEILRYFAKHGYKKFHLLDIWDEQNWEALRLLAIGRGYKGIPSDPVVEPSPLIKFYNRIVNNTLSIQTVINKGLRFFKRKMLP